MSRPEGGAWTLVDPFDRLPIAQARHEGMAILTADERFKKYDVLTIW
jgi:PIN domain nuclease of toxin-antitoxin system